MRRPVPCDQRGGGGSVLSDRESTRDSPKPRPAGGPPCRCGAVAPAPLEGETCGCRPRAPTSLNAARAIGCSGRPAARQPSPGEPPDRPPPFLRGSVRAASTCALEEGVVLGTRHAVATRRPIVPRTPSEAFEIAKRKKGNQNSKASNLSKRRENEVGKKWRGAEAVYEAEGVGSRQ
jgi:hypothetical protein